MTTTTASRQGGSKRKGHEARYDNTDRYIDLYGREGFKTFHKYVQETYGIFEVDTWLGRAIATGRPAPWEDVISAAPAGMGPDELRYRDRFGPEAHQQLIGAVPHSMRVTDFCPWIELALAIGEPYPWKGGCSLGVPEYPRDLLGEVAANPGDPIAAIAAYRAARRVRQLESWRRPPLQPAQPQPAAQPKPTQPQPATAAAPAPAPGPEPAVDEITVALNPNGGQLAKRVYQGRVYDPRFLTQYRYVVGRIGGLRDLFRALQLAAANGAFAVRGRPKAAVGRRAAADDPVKGPAGLEEVSRRYAGLDFDSVMVAGVDPLDGPACARALLPLLPPELQRASLIWQLTAGAGVKPGIRLRTWHWFDRPLSSAELHSWLSALITGAQLDPSTARTGAADLPRRDRRPCGSALGHPRGPGRRHRDHAAGARGRAARGAQGCRGARPGAGAHGWAGARRCARSRRWARQPRAHAPADPRVPGPDPRRPRPRGSAPAGLQALGRPRARAGRDRRHRSRPGRRADRARRQSDVRRRRPAHRAQHRAADRLVARAAAGRSEVMALQPATAPVASWPPELAEMLVHELLGRGWLVLAHGPQGSGKTFISVSLAWHLSLGLRWRGRTTARGTVVYCCPPEGAGSIKRRFDALARSSGVAASPTLLMSTELDLLDVNTWDGIMAAVADIALVVLDYGSSLSDVSLDLIAVCERIRAQSGAAVLAHSENAILPRGA